MIKMYLNSFSYFRAVAIMFIVVGHLSGSIMGPPTPHVANVEAELGFSIVAASSAHLDLKAILWATIRNLILGGTALFVFISGFLFHHVFYKRFKYSKFLSGKFKNVLIPYLIISPLAIIIFIHNGTVLEGHELGVTEFIGKYLLLLWTGHFLTVFWYIPFIILTFLLSPLHFKFIGLSLKSQFWIVAVFLLISVFLQRPVHNYLEYFSPVQALVYFTPVYLIGIMSSLHREKLFALLQGKELWLILLVLIFALLQALDGRTGNYHSPAFEFSGVDLIIFQKIFMSLFFMVFLFRLEGKDIGWLSLVADTSFATFFLHPYLILPLST
ncbi:acyltransferase family protein [Methylobacillus sp.]|uniref:acyltransferase family protein n=1 Tax=Methylobacillus sp. TaxID=56818 RepID=UPI002FE38DF3